MGNYQDIVEIGVFDNETILFEGQFPIPEGISTTLMTIDEKNCCYGIQSMRVFADQWLSNLETPYREKLPTIL